MREPTTKIVLIQRARDLNCDVYACFMVFEIAFDKEKYNRLMRILEHIGIDSADQGIIGNLYWHQWVSIKIEDLV